VSLPTRQARVLGRIERSLDAGEPRLTSMFAIFTKLAGDEEMPLVEELDSRWLPFRGWRKRLPRPRPG
jgi:SpoVK/Ycf46/Vps4 family AAA+-type ATPase